MLKFIPLIAVLFSLLLPSHSVAQSGKDITKSVKSEGDSLKLLSWNIYMLPPMVKFSGKKKRANAIGEKLKYMDYDVIVFQEAFHVGARTRIYRQLKDLYPYKEGPSFADNFSIKTSNGVWILSKYPMKEVAKTKFKRVSGFDNKMANKGALMVEVNKNGQPFQIIGTHLNSGGTLDLRASQLQQIQDELVNKHHTPGVPLVVAGDFNIVKANPDGLDSMLCILNMDDYMLDGENQYTYDHKINDLALGKHRETIDYIYFKPEKLKVKRTFRFIPIIEKLWSKKRKSLADHNPVELLLYYQP
ncbi:MAG: sphingomyelin phosphodiesterase [Chitinophagales bacterium]|nr:sphingomyelin phosphodiesterase [Chitinophagales bacterium]